MGNRNLLPLPQYIFILFFIRARGPGIRRARRVCVLARARVYAKGRYFSLRNAPGRFQVVWSRRKSVSSFFCEFAHIPSFVFPFCVLEKFYPLFYSSIFPIKTHRSICALVVYFHHKTHALTPPHEEQNDDDDFNLFCYHYFSASDGWHGLDADDFLFDDGDDDEEDELLLEKDEYDQTTTKPPPTNRRGSRWE